MHTDNEIIALGHYVEDLFRQDHFSTLCEEFERQSVEAMLQTLPHETKKREALYASVQGKRELINLMLEYPAARDKIIQKSEQPTEAADDGYDQAI